MDLGRCKSFKIFAKVSLFLALSSSVVPDRWKPILCKFQKLIENI